MWGGAVALHDAEVIFVIDDTARQFCREPLKSVLQTHGLRVALPRLLQLDHLNLSRHDSFKPK